MIFELLQSFVNIFAGGRSNIKVILFIIYALLIVALYFIFKKKPLKKYSWKYFGIGVMTMYVYGLALHFFYTLNNKISFWKFFITGSNADVSCSSFNHIHTAKATIGLIFSYFGKTQFRNADAGNAYLGHFPDIIFLFGSILLLFLIISAIFYFITSFGLLLKDKNKRQTIFLIIGYIILSFSIIKTSIDGGIFHIAFIMNVCFIALFILREKKQKLSIIYYLIISFIGLSLIVIGRTTNFSFFYLDSSVITQTAALILLYTSLLYGSEKKIRLYFEIIILLFFIGSCFAYNIYSFNFFYNYSKTIIRKGAVTYLYNKEEGKVETFITDKKESIAELIDQFDRNLYYMPITVPGINCQERITQKISPVLILNTPLTKNALSESKFIRIENEASIKYENKWRTNTIITLNSCLPEKLEAIDSELRKNNITDYILLFNGSSL